VTPRRVFVDTGAWFAVQTTDDALHAVAARALRSLVDRAAVLVTTNQVIGETYTLLRVVTGYESAARFLEVVGSTKRLERIFVGREIEQRAMILLERFRDHDFSFVDATSFAVMQARRLRWAFAFDAHFATAGFVRIPWDLSVDQI
jgi:predicted nucleic acid-binding protein